MVNRISQFKIAKAGNSAVIDYACDELSKYLHLIDESCITEIRSYPVYDETVKDVIWVGQGINVPLAEDDTILIDVKSNDGIISGSNERSVLFSVYRFLFELGCRFYRYCASSEDCIKYEYIPKKQLNDITVSVKETASYMHRSICIEGFDSYEHIEAIINWMPKVGLNGYYVQFKVPHTFFNGWSSHADNPYIDGKDLSRDDVMAIYEKLREDIKKRGLSLHAVGHGWTCEPLGLDGSGWYECECTLDDEKRQLLAQINGERTLYQNMPLITNLCYSNPLVRDLITDAIVDYCEKNGQVDYLHFWLGDSRNAQCECDECKKLRPSDYYVMMLNSLDEKLSAKGIRTKIVFLIYYDLLWKSETVKINNPDRFVLMFAPITRTYAKSFTDYDMKSVPPVPPYKRNDFTLPRDVGENLSFLKDWQQDFHGDSFDFDYHLMWDHVRDVGYTECAKVLHTDMCNLGKIGLNGMVSCQIQRASYPTNLPMYAMAKALWDKKSDFEDVKREYFKAEYGENADEIMNYLSVLTRLINLPYFRRELEPVNADIQKDYISASHYVRDYREQHLLNIQNSSISYSILLHHSYMTEIIMDALACRAADDTDGMEKQLDLLCDYAHKHEWELHRFLDVHNFLYVIRATMKKQ